MRMILRRAGRPGTRNATLMRRAALHTDPGQIACTANIVTRPGVTRITIELELVWPTTLPARITR